jgi:hypothetical protein
VKTIAPPRPGKFKKAIEACDARDPEALCYELIRTTLTELDDAERPTLGDSVLMELIKTISATTRAVGRGKAANSEAPEESDGGIREWLKEVEGKRGKKL